jgi:predicted aspartyl protease
MSNPHVLPIHSVGAGHPLLCVDATLNGVSRCKFVLDTGNGSEHALLSEVEAAKLSLVTTEFHSKKKEFAVGTEKMAVAHIGKLNSLELGGIKVKNLAVLVSKSVDDLATSTHSEFSGILGYSFFKDYALTFDYKAMTVTLDDSPKPPPSAVGFTVPKSTPLIILDVAIEGLGVRKFVLDTGASADVISPQVMKDLGLKSIQKVPMRGAKGLSEADLVHIPALTFAGHSYKPPFAVAADFLCGLSDVVGVKLDGIIGQTTLRQYRFTIDYIHRCLWAEPVKVVN